MIVKDTKEYWEFQGDFSRDVATLVERQGPEYAGLVKINYSLAVKAYENGELFEKALDVARRLKDGGLIKRFEKRLKNSGS